MLKLRRDSRKRLLVVEATGPDRKRYKENDILTPGALALEILRGTKCQCLKKTEEDNQKQT